MGLIEIVLLGALFFVGCLFSAFERYALTVAYITALLAGGWFFFGHPVQDFVATTGWRTILLYQVPLYLGAGLVIALLKWFILVLKTAGAIKDAKETFNPDSKGYVTSKFSKELIDKPEAFRRAKFIDHWNTTITDRYNSPHRDFTHHVSLDNVTNAEWLKPEIITDLLTPKAKNHIDDISYWIFFWPFVVVSTLFKDLIVKIAKHTARFFDWAFNRMSRLVISNAAKDI